MLTKAEREKIKLLTTEERQTIKRLSEEFDTVTVTIADKGVTIFARIPSIWDGHEFSPPIYKGWNLLKGGELKIIGERIGEHHWGRYI